MKKIITILMALIMIFSLAACGEKKEEKKDEPVISGVPNPNVSYNSLEEINKIVGCKLAGTGAMGTSDESYTVISEKIAQYCFTIGGAEYTYRAAKTTDDICGIYYNEGTAFSAIEPAEKLTVLALGEGMVGRWFDGEMQYSLYKDCSKTGELDQEGFTGICADYVAQTCEVGDNINKISGFFTDSTSQRATAEVLSFGNHAWINITWGSSVSEADDWIMDVEYKDGRYVYSDGAHTRSNFDEKGEATTEIIAEKLEGYFEPVENGFAWTGASEEDVKGCVFVKAE